jgi:hypothetical protein
MPPSTAIALIIANFLPLFFCFHYISKLANDVGADIETGVLRGIPVSIEYRRIMLYAIWVGYGLGAVTCGIFAAILNIRIAAYVDDGDIKAVAYVAAVIGGVGAVAYTANGVLSLIHYRSTLRQAEAD